MYSCFLSGHRDAPSSVQPALDKLVEELICLHGVTFFYVGCYGNFDTMAVSAVQKALSRRPEVLAFLVIPYHPSERQYALPDFFEDTFYPEGMESVPRRYAIPRANRIVLDESDVFVTYALREGGNTAKLLRHARTLEKRGWIKVFNLAECPVSAE